MRVEKRDHKWEWDGEKGVPSFHGLDIGPRNGVSFVGESADGKRVAIKSAGHVGWSGVGQQSYYGPSFYLVEGKTMAYCIDYERATMHKAKDLVKQYLSGVDLMPGEFT